MEKETKKLLNTLNKRKDNINFLLDVVVTVDRLEENQRAMEQKYQADDEVLIKNKEDINKLKKCLQEQMLDL